MAPRVFTRLEAAGRESVQSGFTAAIAGMQCVNAMFESVEAWQMRKDLLALRSTEAIEDTH